MRSLLAKIIQDVSIVGSKIIDQRSVGGKKPVKCVDYIIMIHMTVKENLYGILALNFVLHKYIIRVSSIWMST
jgi:hypothetical protein